MVSQARFETVSNRLLIDHLFPQGLARAGAEDTALVPWSRGVNGALEHDQRQPGPACRPGGRLRYAVPIAAGLYAAILLLPAYRRKVSAGVRRCIRRRR